MVFDRPENTGRCPPHVQLPERVFISIDLYIHFPAAAPRPNLSLLVAHYFPGIECPYSMDPYTFTTEQEGISTAEHALDELRVFLHTTSGADRTAQGPSNRAPPVGFHSSDREFALREQLEILEERLRMISDARFARTLIEDENERAVVGNADHNEIILDLLRNIVMTVRDVTANQTYDAFDPFLDDDDGYLSGGQGAGPRSVTSFG
jgi:hypothetical protein